MNYFCYIYYDQSWTAFYCGKGVGYRALLSRHSALPEPHFIHKFYFDEEWQSIECEIELIAFFGRQIDGGTLLNQTIGGRGGSLGLKGKHHYNSKTYELTSPTGQKQIVKGLTEFSRKHGLTTSAICAVANGRRPHHKGWTAVLIE